MLNYEPMVPNEIENQYGQPSEPVTPPLNEIEERQSTPISFPNCPSTNAKKNGENSENEQLCYNNVNIQKT